MALAVIVLTVCVVVVGILLPPPWLIRFVARLHPGVLFYVPTTERVVALTIDDGPHPVVTPGILDVLSRHGAHATFFVIGERVAGNEALLERAVRDGHEIGNHDLRDRTSALVGRDRLLRELGVVDRLLRPYGEIRWFRPGRGWFTAPMVRQAGILDYRVCLASVYAYDTRIPSDTVVRALIETRVFPGAILVIHDGGPGRCRNIEILDRVLADLTRRDYGVVTVSELVSRQQNVGS